MSIAQLTGGGVITQVRKGSQRDGLMIAAYVSLSIIAVLSVVGLFYTPYDPEALYAGDPLSPASLDHLFGTDDLGRDILSRVMSGSAISVLSPIGVVVLSTSIGALIGILSAWYGGFVDGLFARLIDVIFAIPGLVLAILAVAIFGKGLTAPIIALSIAYIPITARLIRAVARSELSKPYFAALWVQGVSAPSSLFKHLLPALIPALLAQAAVGYGYAMLDLAAISYLGLGLQPPQSDWGSMVASGQPSILSGAPEQSLFPAILIVITVLSVSLIGAKITEWSERKLQ